MSMLDDETMALLQSAQQVQQPKKSAGSGAVKSDGGSSSYYEIELPPELLTRALERHAQTGRCYIETEDIIRYALGNDFDRGNIFKCMVRIKSLESGKGKAGNTALYDASKIVYSAEKMKAHYKAKEPQG